MHQIELATHEKTGFYDITSKVGKTLSKFPKDDGILLCYSPHTTAGITINEGADPAVQHDILAVLNSIVPWNADYRHAEGNSAAHIKTSLMGSNVNVAVENGHLCLGTWQRIFFCEFDGPRKRKVWLKLI